MTNAERLSAEAKELRKEVEREKELMRGFRLRRHSFTERVEAYRNALRGFNFTRKETLWQRLKRIATGAEG